MIHYRAGVAAALSGDLLGAERHAAEVVRLDPGNGPATDLAAVARSQRSAKQGAPNLAAVKLALRDGRVRTAERLASKALDKASTAERAGLLKARAEALLRQGRSQEALQALKAAAQATEPTPATWLQLGEAAAQLGDRKGARYYYELAADTAAPGDRIGDDARARLVTLK